eukprot:TRINITY_DN10674_c0_g1_i1.p1 TRINITY_DN10674_c0_g1~~TRINITY_DN10674_c0_g1_i1.p1  ORF type:complete len:201 (-),score=52.61 TRINITY_DN10674_c0_g1_i1:50-598(-)
MAAVDDSVRFGDELIIYGHVRQGSTLIRQGASALRLVGHQQAQAVVLQVCCAPGSDSETGSVVMADSPVVLRTHDGYFFQRTELMYDDHHWRCGRFSLGFSDRASQTLHFHGVQGAVQYGLPIGLSFAGQEETRTHPDTNDRRFLTLRPEDQPNSVVDVYNTDERLILTRIQRRANQDGWFK